MSDLPVVDCRGLRCPWPALRLARAMRGGRAVILLADDPAAPAELAALAAAQGWHFGAEADRMHRFRIAPATNG